MSDPVQFGFHGIFDFDLIHIFADGIPGFRLEQMGKIKFAVAGIFLQGGQGSMADMCGVDILFDRIDDFFIAVFRPFARFVFYIDQQIVQYQVQGTAQVTVHRKFGHDPVLFPRHFAASPDQIGNIV